MWTYRTLYEIIQMRGVMQVMSAQPGRPHALTVKEVQEVVKLKAMGVSNEAIAQVHNVHPATIGRYLKSPEALELLTEYRDIIRYIILQRSAERLVNKVADAVEHAETPKDIDAATRALMNLEKTSASASGEAKKVEMTGSDGQPLAIDIRAILARATDA